MSASRLKTLKKRLASFSVLAQVLSIGMTSIALPNTAIAAATLTAASGGNAIASSAVNGSWTTLTGPILNGIDGNDMPENGGTLTLTIPSGFEFDTGGTTPTVLVTCTNDCGGGANNNVGNVANGGTIGGANVTVTSTTVTVTFSDDADTTGGHSNITNRLTWQNLRVRPTAVLPLASGNIVASGMSISGVSTTNFGTLTETGPTCNGQNGTIVVVNNTIYGGPMNGLPYANILIGTSGNDVIVTGGADAYVEGLDGNDTICGGNGNDILNGGEGNDIIFGGNGNDALTGGNGSDNLNGDASNDVISGGPGTDSCSGGTGSDSIGACGGANEGTSVGTVTVLKDVVPNDAQDFSFSGTWSFSRDDDSDATLPNSFTIAATQGSKTVTESVVSGWSLTGLVCTGGGANTSTNLGTFTASIGLDADEDVSCTFTNSAYACGNGVMEGAEECDDGNAVDTDSCTSLCTIAE